MEEVIDIGDMVLCDLCNADYTDSDKQGGVLIGSYAVCPECEKEKFQGEKADEKCPPDTSFKEWVLGLRGGNNTIRITSWHPQ